MHVKAQSSANIYVQGDPVKSRTPFTLPIPLNLISTKSHLNWPRISLKGPEVMKEFGNL